VKWLIKIHTRRLRQGIYLFSRGRKRRDIRAEADCAIIAVVKSIVGIVEVRLAFSRVALQAWVHVLRPIVNFLHREGKYKKQEHQNTRCSAIYGYAFQNDIFA
jgi:hypothetical protein